MATLPPSPFTSFADVQSAETLVVAPSPQAPVAAASGPFESGDTDCPPDEAAASPGLQALDAAADICDIGEIFVGARKLDAPRFVLDVDRFMAELEDVPLFLRQAV
jgi:hypothetical protein